MIRWLRDKRSVWTWGLASLLLLATGCQQIAEGDIESVAESAQTSTLAVLTRAGDDAEIVYPVSVFAFDSTGKLVTKQTLSSASASISLALGVGDYKIVAVGGTSKGYTVPANPSLTDVVTLDSKGLAATPMMMGKADFSVTKTGKNAQLTVTMSYVVTSLSIVLNNVPSDVEGVKLSLSSFYTSLSFDGTYSAGGNVVTLDCEQTDDGLWQAENLYLFPTDKKETLYSITFEYANTTETYAYTYPSALTAGLPFRFEGSYNGSSYIGGSLVMTGWGTTVDVNFSFGTGGDGSNGSSSNSNSDSNSNSSNSNGTVNATSIPAVGDIWNKGIVVGVSKTSDTEADVLLMSLIEWISTTTEAADYVSNYATSSGLSWRMMTDTEAKNFKSELTTELISAINTRIASQAGTYDELSTEDGARYLCSKDGALYSFRMESSGSVTKAGSSKSYLLRAVRTVHCKL